MKKLLMICTVALGLTATSCDSYLDINQDPNSPAEGNMTAGMILPAAEMHLSASYGYFLRLTGGYYAQHYAHQFGVSNWLDASRFMMSATRSSSTYSQLTSRCLNNLEVIRKMCVNNEDWGTYLAATTLRAFAYQVLVDCYGEVPYTEALNPSIPSPVYDDGATIYKGILAELDEALGKVNGSETVVTNFLFPSATASKWIQFANALKLRILMRMSNVENVQTQLASLIAENNFPTADVCFANCWANESGKANPFFWEELSPTSGTQKNVILNIALCKTMEAADDARLGAFFTKNSSGVFTGGVSGTNFSLSSSYQAAYWSRPTGDYNTPVYLISVAETNFFLAEYEVRFGSADKAEAYYKAAIEASFATAGVEGVDAVLAAYPWDANNYKKVIGIQKWVALSGINSYEAWCELRRLGYPAFGSISGNDMTDEGDNFDTSIYEPGTLYTPIYNNASLGANKILQRFPYAESSANRNENTPVYPGDASPVFWAK